MISLLWSQVRLHFSWTFNEADFTCAALMCLKRETLFTRGEQTSSSHHTWLSSAAGQRAREGPPPGGAHGPPSSLPPSLGRMPNPHGVRASAHGARSSHPTPVSTSQAVNQGAGEHLGDTLPQCQEPLGTSAPCWAQLSRSPTPTASATAQPLGQA